MKESLLPNEELNYSWNQKAYYNLGGGYYKSLQVLSGDYKIVFNNKYIKWITIKNTSAPSKGYWIKAQSDCLIK